MPSESVSTTVVDGLALANEIRKELAERVGHHVAAGRRAPKLAVMLVGDDPASASYIKGKRRACDRIGMDSSEHSLPADASAEAVMAALAALNADAGVDGILVQLPLPGHLDANAVTGAVDPAKDVDGLHPMNAGRLLLGEPCLTACTPLGILEILERFEIPLEGADAVVIGRSNIVGKPVALLLQRANATVSMCHSRTRDLRERCRAADVLVAAAGVPLLVQRDWVKPGAAVIDVGVTVVDGVLTGDVDTEGVQGVARIVTPHRRGVGPMTITMLLRNTLDAYEARTGACRD
jgi:methylenetetrahydrofolate dehydrogenase (NADP+)/methenyltetrahydrofolate cyclohydrolase